MSNAILMRPMMPVAFTAHGTAAGFDPINVGNDYMGVQWKGTPAVVNWLLLDMGADVSADWIALLNVGGVSGGNIEIRAATAAQGSAMSGGVGAGANQYQLATVPTVAGTEGLPNGRRAAHWIAAPGTFTGAYRYWRVSVDAGGAFQWRFARIAIGKRIQLQRNFSFGDLSRLVETNDAYVTQLNTYTEAATGLVVITIKINRIEVSDIVATFQRYDNAVKHFYGEEEYFSFIRETM